MTQTSTLSLAGRRPPLAARPLLAMLERLQAGSMRLTLPGGDILYFEGRQPGPQAELHIRQWAALPRLLQRGDIGVAEAYRDGQLDSPDLLQVLLLALANEQAMDRALHGNALGTALYRLRHWLNRNTRSNSKRNIHAHYDIGNNFYRLWLDASMTYSSALFSHPEQDLYSAQYAKYDRLLSGLNLKPGDHLLEIGCGWGALAEHAARHYGVRVTGISLSQEQLAYARARVAGQDIANRIDFRFQDYRDLQGQFDAIVSVEMLEAVGEQWWPTYFRQVQRCLRPGGRAAIQTITIANERFEDYRSKTDFIQQYIFPGGMLPSPERLDRECARAGLLTVDRHDFGLDYAETLRRWRLAFEQQLPAIRAQGFDEAFIRLWRFYYWYCEAGFLTGRTGVRQVLLTRMGSPS